MTEHSAAGPLLGPAEIRELADRAGIRPTKTLGQNFVIDPNTIRPVSYTHLDVYKRQVNHTVRGMAQLLDAELETLCRRIWDNARTVYGQF